jgi:hypothetical protein
LAPFASVLAASASDRGGPGAYAFDIDLFNPLSIPPLPDRSGSKGPAGRSKQGLSMKAVANAVRSFGPYLLIEMLAPGGTLIALALYLYRRSRGGADPKPFRTAAA